VLKQLDREGIVKPRRKKGKARLYSKREIKKIERCWFYIKKHHVNMEGLKIILQMEEGISNQKE
jgi:DNA-binding transcriptional MerR regulator